MSVSQGKVKSRSSWVKPAGPGQRLVTGDDRDGGGLRQLPTGDQIDRGLVLRVAGARAHLVGQVGGAGMERARQNQARGGGRSSDGVGFDAVVHGRRSWWWLRAPGAALSTKVSLASSHYGSSHDGTMAGGGELSGAVEVATTEAKRARELGEEEEELTAGSERGSASSGRSWRRRIDQRRARVPEAEDEGEDGVRWCLASRESTERHRRRWRSS